MGSLKFLLQYRPLLPWICSSLAIGYAAYLHWKLRRLKEDSKKQQINKDQDNLNPRHEVNIDAIDRNCQVQTEGNAIETCCSDGTNDGCGCDEGINNSVNQLPQDVSNKRVAYCRCWKSDTFPLCDGKHMCHNQDNEDKVGPLVLVWNEPELRPLDTSIIEHDKDMDIKSFDSESPILQSSNSDSNGEFEPMGKIGDTINTSSDEQLSSLEMIEENFDTQPDEKEFKEDDDFDEDTVKIDN